MAKRAEEKEDALFAALGKPVGAPADPAETKERPHVAEPAVLAPPASGRTEKVTITLYPEDRQVIRELSAWFAGQGLPSNASLMIKTALKAARTGSELLAAYQEVRSRDKRVKKNVKEP